MKIAVLNYAVLTSLTWMNCLKILIVGMIWQVQVMTLVRRMNSLRVAKNENRLLVNDINAAIDILMSTDCFEIFQKFLRVQWNRIYEKIKDCMLAENEHKVERKKCHPFLARCIHCLQATTSQSNLRQF